MLERAMEEGHPVIERTRQVVHDVRVAGSSHPFVVIGLGMVLIAALAIGALFVAARRKGLSARELASMGRWSSERDGDELAEA